MTITQGLGLQAIGIIFEAIGLIWAFRSFHPAKDQWLKGVDGKRIGFPKTYVYAGEARSFTLQMVIIGIGLAFQLVGLFIP